MSSNHDDTPAQTDDEHVASSLAMLGNEPIGLTPAADRPVDLDAIISGALTVLDHVEPQELYIPDLAPDYQERVDHFLRRGRAEARCNPTGLTWTCSSPGARSDGTVRCRHRRRQSRRS